METANFYTAGYSVYPGEYVPVLNEEVIQEELKHVHEGDSILPPVNVIELADSYRVEVAIPGTKREEFLILADNNILSISGMHSDSHVNERPSFRLHEFNYHCFDRHVVLPADADAALGRAEYKGGMLCVYVPKTKQPGKHSTAKIVVY